MLWVRPPLSLAPERVLVAKLPKFLPFHFWERCYGLNVNQKKTPISTNELERAREILQKKLSMGDRIQNSTQYPPTDIHKIPVVEPGFFRRSKTS